MITWFQSLLTSELVDQLRFDITVLREEKNRLQDLILQKHGYLDSSTLPGEREGEPSHVPVKRMSRMQIRRNLEKKYAMPSEEKEDVDDQAS